MDAAYEPVPKRRLLLGRFGGPAPPGATANVPPRVVIAEPPPASQTVVQMLPSMIFKSMRGARFAMPLTSSAEGGSFKCFRKQGPSLGPPFNFSFPSIVHKGESVGNAAAFGFIGYLEFNECGLAAGTTGTTTCTPAPAFKLNDKNIYPAVDNGSVVAQEDPPVVNAAELGPAWNGLELAKFALVVNSAAFFNTSRFEKIVVLASGDTKSFRVDGPCVSISKTHTGVVATANAAPQRPRVHSPALSRYVLVLNPPADVGHGARVTGVTGGTTTVRGTITPLKLTLEPASAAMGTTKREVTLWTGDARAIFGSPPNYKSPAILLINGTPSLSDGGNGVEFTVRGGVVAIDDRQMVSLTSDTLKSMFNKFAHDPRIGGGTAVSYDSAADGVLSEGRTMPMGVCRASINDVVLVKRAELLKLVRTTMGACRPGACESETAIAALANAISNEQLSAAVEAVDNALAHTGDFETARENLSDVSDDDAAADDAKRAIAVLCFFEGLDKVKTEELRALVKRKPRATADEVVADDDEEDDDADLCKGI